MKGRALKNVNATVWIHSTTGNVPRALSKVLDTRVPIEVVHSMELWPPHTDFYCTQGKLTGPTIRAANAVGALVVNLPNGGQWLAGAVWRRLLAGQSTYLFYACRAGEPAYIPFLAGREALWAGRNDDPPRAS